MNIRIFIRIPFHVYLLEPRHNKKTNVRNNNNRNKRRCDVRNRQYYYSVSCNFLGK